MKTYLPKEITLNEDRKWYLVDAKDKTLGRLAVEVAVKLRGKDKPQFTPHLDCGDHVIVINADKIKVTGAKLGQKTYYRHSGYPGALKERTLGKMMEERPEEVITKAVRGMMPRNKLRRTIMAKLKVFAGTEHPHEAQKPIEIKDFNQK
jgi:large subunit ribosomal protein L13